MKSTRNGNLVARALGLALVVPMFLPYEALAQSDTTELEEIVVTGSRYRGLQEIQAKYDSDVIYDSLSSDDISAVPDFNIADAFRRIAGISAEFDEDEGRFINVRGIDSNLNRVTFDGITIPSTGSFGGSGRNVNIEFLPSTAVKRLEVYKTFNPSIDGSSIGGYVNVVTRSAFDAKDFYLVTKATVSDYWEDIPFGNDLPFRAEFTTSNRFGANDQFGFILTGLYSQRPRDQEKFFGVSPRTGIANSENAALPPNRFNVSLYNNDQERYGANGRFEYKSDQTYAYFSAYNYQQVESEVRYVNNVTGFGGNDVTLTGSNSGDVTDVRFDVTSSDFPIETQGKGTHFHVERLLASEIGVTFDAGFAEQTFDHDTTDVNFRFDPGNADLDFSYEVGSISGIPTRTAVGDVAGTTDPTNYFNNFTRFRDLNTDEEVAEFKLDFDRNSDSDSRGFGWRAGLAHRNLERIRDNDEYRFIGNSTNSLVDFGSVLSNRTFNSEFQPEPFVFIDANSVRAFFAAEGLGGPDLNFDQGRSDSSDFTYEEHVFSAYAQLSYASDRFRVSGGLRHEGTDFDSTARNEADSITTGDFDHLLPSINFTYAFTEDLKIRLAYSETLGRPNPGDLTSTLRVTDLTLNPNGDTGRTDDVELIVTRGNPNLKPRDSDNFDISLEYYFLNGEGLLSGAWFDKDISGDIFRSEEIGVYEGRPAEFRQNINLEKSEVSGFELSFYMGTLDFLPGPLANLGVSTNVTWLDGKMNVPVGDEIVVFNSRFRQPGRIVNAALFYNTEKFEGRVAYNNTDGFALNTGRAEGDYQQIDASLKYRATEHWHVKLTGRNLAGKARQQFDDYPDFGYQFLFGRTEIDPSYHLSVTFIN